MEQLQEKINKCLYFNNTILSMKEQKLYIRVRRFKNFVNKDGYCKNRGAFLLPAQRGKINFCPVR